MQALAAPRALACRDNNWENVVVKDLVPGDLIALKGGDLVPADCKVCAIVSTLNESHNNRLVFMYDLSFAAAGGQRRPSEG